MRTQLLFAVVVLAGRPAFTEAPAPATASQFAQTWAFFAKAMNAKDPDGAAAVFADDGELYPPGSDIVKGRAAIANFYKRGTDAGNTLAVISLAAQASGDIGYETGIVSVTLKDEEGEDGEGHRQIREYFRPEGRGVEGEVPLLEPQPRPEALKVGRSAPNQSKAAYGGPPSPLWCGLWPVRR
jgi:ketosteroid isomerase-like protein